MVCMPAVLTGVMMSVMWERTMGCENTREWGSEGVGTVRDTARSLKKWPVHLPISLRSRYHRRCGHGPLQTKVPGGLDVEDRGICSL